MMISPFLLKGKIKMPEVIVKGKKKKFAYTAKGKMAAKKAMMAGGSMEDDMEKKFKANRAMKKKSHYRMS